MQLRMTHITFFFFILTALSGVWMRLNIQFESLQFIPYSHLLHAHSHMAVLGWTFFAVFLIFVVLIRQQTSKFVKVLTFLLFIVTFLMFIAFLVQGYALYSIIFSTLHIFLEYAVAYFIVSRLWRNKTIPKTSRLFLYGSVVMLIISSIGPFALGAIASQGLRDSPLFEMAIYFYLHFQYNGWLYLILIGMFLLIIHRKQINYSEKMMQYSFWIYAIALFPGFFLSILWYDFGLLGISFGIIGAVGQLIGVLLFIVSIVNIRGDIKQKVSPFIYFSLILVLMLLAIKSLMELGLLHVSFGELIYDTRSVVIGYLHLTLLGFISIFILMQFYLTNIIENNDGYVKVGFLIFIISFILNELVLFLSGLLSWLQLGAIPFNNSLLSIASILLTFAILFIWLSTVTKQHKQMKI